MTAYYPGDAYVDWAGEDDYNYGGTAGHAGGWNDFTSQLQPLYRTFSTRKPIMIGEMSSVDQGPRPRHAWSRQGPVDLHDGRAGEGQLPRRAGAGLVRHQVTLRR